MKRIMMRRILGIIFVCLFIPLAYGDDIREIELTAREKKAALLKKVEQERMGAQKEAEERKQRILSDKDALLAAIIELKNQVEALEGENRQLMDNFEAVVGEKKELEGRLGEVDAVIRELIGFIRTNAKDLGSLLDESFQGAFDPHQGDRLKLLADKATFPGMDDIKYMVDLFFKEVQHSGEVRVETGTLINRSGEEISGNILVVGNFTAAYKASREVGFLNYSSQDRRLFALSKLPPYRIKKKIKQYMAGISEDVPIDVSRGGALTQLTRRLSLFEQIPKGGPIVWPIIGILVLALMIITERLIFLAKKNMDTEHFMNTVNGLVLHDNWEGCRSLCDQYKEKPLSHVILAGANFKDMEREDMESAIQETILREIPPLERFLSTLGMLAAISPLLGLLGTVTGMINTFHVITYYGTGDPRMMSGGISEALVTTMLGLMVAIPIMFSHTLLTRRVENMIGELEEKAVSFINSVYKSRNNR